MVVWYVIAGFYMSSMYNMCVCVCLFLCVCVHGCIFHVDVTVTTKWPAGYDFNAACRMPDLLPEAEKS